MPSQRSRPAPRSLADDLRGRDDAALVALLRARPDLASPAPSGTATLAARATTRASVQRALDRLDTPTLQVAAVMAAIDEPTSRTALASACGGRVDDLLATLREQGLVWGADRSLRLVRTAADVLGPHPAGLGPPLADALGTGSPARLAELAEDLGVPPAGDPAVTLQRVAAHLADPATVRTLLDQAPDGARQVLERLAVDGPVGSVGEAERQVRAATAGTPVSWLLAHGLLVAAGPGRVVLPREVGRAMRDGRVLPRLDRVPPEPGLTPRSDRLVEGTAAGAAAEAVRLVGELGALWGRSPAPVLRAGGVGVRELKRVADALDVDGGVAARVVELAAAAGLVAVDGAADPVWAPTPAFDAWADRSVPARWRALAVTWRETSRVPGLVGSRDSRDTPRPALAADLDRPAAPAVRASVLADLAGMPTGVAASAASLAERWAWRTPRRDGGAARRLLAWTLEEAAWLGVTGAGALSAPGRHLTLGEDDAAERALAAALPAPVDHVLLQADLTAVAPGPLEAGLATELALVADVDSRGGATVYRFGPASVRRALDAGRTADELLSMLAAHSRTPVPQPLEYLVTDTARRHGRVRVGAASSYVRADDPSALDELLADPRAAGLRLRRLAPTVLASPADPVTVLETLRAVGGAPVAEGPEGDVVLRAAGAHRAPARRPPRPVTGEPPRLDDEAARAVVRTVRAGDEGPRERPSPADAAPDVPAMDPASSLAALRAAAGRRRRVWIGVVDPGGRTRRRLVEPLGVDGGRVTVYDHGVDEVRALSVHRLTGVAPADER